MALEIARRLIAGTWRTGIADENGGGAAPPRVVGILIDGYYPENDEQGYGLDLAVPTVDPGGYVNATGSTAPFFDVPAGGQFLSFLSATTYNGDENDTYSVGFNVYVYSLDGSEAVNFRTTDPLPLVGGSFVVVTLAGVSLGWSRGSDLSVEADDGGRAIIESVAGGDFRADVFVGVSRLT